MEKDFQVLRVENEHSLLFVHECFFHVKVQLNLFCEKQVESKGFDNHEYLEQVQNKNREELIDNLRLTVSGFRTDQQGQQIFLKMTAEEKLSKIES